MPLTRFTKELRDEAVRLALTSGRSWGEVAADLGIGLSTLRHWLDRRREREIDNPPEERQEDMATELKRLQDRRSSKHLKQRQSLRKPRSMSSHSLPISRVACSPPCSGGRRSPGTPIRLTDRPSLD
jgi:transposase